jgi:preprotein translocase SecE subunit
MLTTGKSSKEACLLSPEDAEKTYPVIPQENAGRVRQPKGFLGFLGKVQQEMKLVHHPDWKEVRSTTLVVIVFVFLFATYLRTLDWIFSPLEHWLFAH